jgi:hypothetical protein
MSSSPRVGLSARELKRRWDWQLKYPPKDPAALIDRMGEVVVQLISENNAAIERELVARGVLDANEEA